MHTLQQIIVVVILLTFSCVPVITQAEPAADTQAGQMVLTKQEKSWLDAHPIIRVGIDRDFAPYESIDKEGKFVGMAADYLRLLQKRMGVRFEIISDRSWAEILEMAKRGELDMLSSAVKTPERSLYLIFTKPYKFSSAVIIDNGGGEFIGGLNHLDGKRVAVEKGYFMQELLERNYPGIRLTPAEDTKEALKLVVEGKADAYVGDAGAANYAIKKFGLISLRFSGQTEYKSEHSIAVSKSNPELASIITKAMATISPKESDDIFNHWLGLKIEQGIKIETVFKYSAGVLCFLLMLAFWMVSLKREIAIRKRAEQTLSDAAEKIRKSEALYRLLTEDVRDVVWKLDSDLRVTYISPADEQLRGYRVDEVIGHHVFEMFTEEGVAAVTKILQKRLVDERHGTQTGAITFEVQHHCKDGRLLWGEVFSTPERDSHGAITGFHGITREISGRKQMEEQIRQQAFHDTLTNLPNRRMLNDRMSQAMAASKRRGFHCALMFLDLDNFKPLNDTHGHEVGDLLLIEAADRLKTSVRETDTVARIGGDEFVVMLRDLHADLGEAISHTRMGAEKIRIALSNPYSLTIRHEGKADTVVQHHCTVSIGVAMFKAQEATQEDILKWADAAMYEAKEAGRNLVRFHDSKA